MTKEIQEYYKALESKLKYIKFIDYRDTVSSTQTVAKQVFTLYKDNYLIVAGTQTEGVGRFKREWKSPEETGFYGSFVFKNRLQKDKLPSFNLFVSLALVETFKYYTDDISIKWPNDIFLQGKKVSGILTETYSSNGEEGIILGIGINLNRSDDLFLNTAITLEDIIQSKVSIPMFLSRFFTKIEKYYERYLRESFEDIRDEYLKYSNVLGKKLTFSTTDGKFTGTTVDIDNRGFLKVFDESGKIRTIMSADIEM